MDALHVETRMIERFEPYLNICDEIYWDWVSNQPEPGLESFDLDYVPEPYLNFGDGEDVCVFLTTNPGGGLDIQRPAGLRELCGGELPSHYRPLATILSHYYELSGHLKGAPLANIRAMRSIAAAFGYGRVIQVEMVPWHSRSFPNKRKMLEKLSRHPRFVEYSTALRALLDGAQIVLSWSGGDPSKRGGDGVNFKAEALRLDLEGANFHEITRTERPSQALLWQKDKRGLRGIFVNRAAANLPKGQNKDGSDRYLAIATTINDHKGASD